MKNDIVVTHMLVLNCQYHVLLLRGETRLAALLVTTLSYGVALAIVYGSDLYKIWRAKREMGA